MENLEKVYDEQIHPLMDQIIAICQKHNMPMVATFEYASEHFCSTALLPNGCSKTLLASAKILKDGFLAFAVSHTGKSRAN